MNSKSLLVEDRPHLQNAAPSDSPESSAPALKSNLTSPHYQLECDPPAQNANTPQARSDLHDQQNGWLEPMASAALTGLAGEIVRTIEPHTEADPVAILLQFLVAFGNVVGRNPF